MKKYIYKTKKGFNLIEIMVTIAVITILSSAVTLSISHARKKAIDTDIISNANFLMQNAQVTTRGNQDYSNWLIGIQKQSSFGDFMYIEATCDGQFATASDFGQVRSVCKKILEKNKNEATFVAPDQGPLYVGSLDTLGTQKVKLSVMAYLPGKGKMYCTGSNGKSSSESDKEGRGCGNNTVGAWRCPGCRNDVGE